MVEEQPMMAVRQKRVSYLIAWLVGLGIAICTPDLAGAQREQITMKDLFDLFTKERTVTTAGLHEQKQREASFSTTIFTREDIKAMGITTMPLLMTEILKTVPGLLTPVIGPRGTLVKVRGNGAPISCSVKFLLNGTDASDTVVHGMELFSLPINVDEVERIEIVRGPGSVLHGPAATQGVINVITKTPEGNQGTHLLSGVGGDNSMASVTQRGTRGNTSYSFHLGGSKQDSFMDRGLEGDLKTGFTRLYLRKSLKGDSSVSLDSSFTNGSKADYQLFFGLNRISRWRGALDLRYTRPRVTFKTTYRITHRSQSPVTDLVANPPDLIRAPFDSLDQVAEHEVTANLDPTKKLHTVLGGGYRYENVQWDLLDRGRQDQNKLYAYINNEYRLLEPLTMVLGLRLDESDFTPAEVSGNLGFVYRPTQMHTVRVLAGNSVFDPPYKIAFINTGILRPIRHMIREKNKSVELGYQGNFGNRVRLETVGYRIIKYHGFGFLPPRGGIRVGFNRRVNTGIWGAEGSLEVLITRQVTSWANYTIAKPSNLDSPNPLDLSYPRNMANGGVKALLGRLLTHLWLNYVDTSIPSGGPARRVPVHIFLNASFNYNLQNGLELFVSSYNLNDNNVREDNLYTEIRTRIVTGGVRWHF